jgi:hypothetical protein
LPLARKRSSAAPTSRSTEHLDGARELLELRQSRTVQIIQIEHQHADALVVCRAADRLDETPERGLIDRTGLGDLDGALERVARELLDQSPLRSDHQRRPLRHGRQRRVQHTDDHDGKRQQQHQTQNFAQPVQGTPQTEENPAHACHFALRQIFSSILAALPERSRR